jgi:hypothetical protein
MTETWINKLPAKGLRFLLALGLGAIIEAFYSSELGAVSAVGLEAADYLLLDGLFRGWRPNQFVEGPLQRLAC